ncbi:hypothetical protein [Branchiibius sp. NY16-3462-2]|uniref:hypothetical protein n=1 Tax=Branchiibius sp. NY16-3462-2 TaxID=1807500 RepID=UPI00079AE09C|nr:hypothetical protein [Branchiibius sp. NY16-3462-2]KYH43247.1 hypothetical protein AZH51_12900 [Branchiibius sp. NY16-3462-2]
MDINRNDVLTVLAQEQHAQATRELHAELDEKDAEQQAESIRTQAIDKTHQLAQAAEQIENELRELNNEAREVLDAAKAGRITKAQAVARLRKARSRYADLAGRRQSFEADLAATNAVIADPAAERDRLLSKYPVLGR